LTAYTHTYTYDNLNRLTGDTDSGGGASRTMTFDQWGNMATGGAVFSGLTPTALSGYNANNQLSSSSFAYDKSGNTTLVGSIGISYDAENKQIATVDHSQQVQASYNYDGAGQRVLKSISNGPSTVFVYDALGRLATESTNAVTKPTCTTCYLSYDHLGSIRLTTDSSGKVISRHDFVPFGEEIYGGYFGRASQFGAVDEVRHRFTGHERDSENTRSFDYFNARYMASVLGRFMSPDPGNAGADVTNPQSWNGYAYALNNPLSFIDPTGLDCITFDDGSQGLDPSHPEGGCGSVRENGQDSNPEHADTNAKSPSDLEYWITISTNEIPVYYENDTPLNEQAQTVLGKVGKNTAIFNPCAIGIFAGVGKAVGENKAVHGGVYGLGTLDTKSGVSVGVLAEGGVGPFALGGEVAATFGKNGVKITASAPYLFTDSPVGTASRGSILSTEKQAAENGSGGLFLDPKSLAIGAYGSYGEFFGGGYASYSCQK